MKKLIKKFMESKYFKFTPRVLKIFLADFVEISALGQIMMFACSLFAFLSFIILTIKLPITLAVAFPMWFAYELTGIDYDKIEFRKKMKQLRVKILLKRQFRNYQNKSHKNNKLSFKS